MPKSTISETRNAAPEARANVGLMKYDRPAPTMMAGRTQMRPSVTWIKSLSVNAAPTKKTAAGATRPNPTLTTPHLSTAQFAAKMVPMYSVNAIKPTIFLPINFLH